MIITWEVDDGYDGKSRPQITEIEEIDFEGLEGYEKEDFINDCVQEDFSQRITWNIIAYDDGKVD